MQAPRLYHSSPLVVQKLAKWRECNGNPKAASALVSAVSLLLDPNFSLRSASCRLERMHVTARTSWLKTFACHEASCRPPGSGGTGGSTPSGAARRASILFKTAVPVHWDEIARVVSSEVQHAELRVRVPLSVVGNILAEGYKTQHETGATKGGKLSPSLRAKIEKKMFGPESSAPVYGYLHDLKATLTALNHHSGDAYGEVALVLKDSVRMRTTVTMGDSLQLREAPAPLRLSEASSWTGADVFAATPHPSYYPTTDSFHVNYIETQIHGGLSINDIDHIVVRRMSKPALPDNPYRSARGGKAVDTLGAVNVIRKAFPGVKIEQTDDFHI